ncbi:MAG TPA: hypothetical protein VMF14_02650 [Solirubrobacteraceae bacterium]|nr:hypothetical protein [Solirubrobacteraceae bacterium]
MFVLATIGASALYLLFVWLISAAAAAWLADRKGYGERTGLFFGLILSAVGFVIVLLLPARPGSTWKVEGALPNPGARRPLGVAGLAPATPDSESPDALGPALAAPEEAAGPSPSPGAPEASPSPEAPEPHAGDDAPA